MATKSIKIINDGRGWFGQSKRHSLASKGIKTGNQIKDTSSFAHKIAQGTKNLWEWEKKKLPEQEAFIKKEAEIVGEKIKEGAKKAYEYEKEHLPEQKQFAKDIFLVDNGHKPTDGTETFKEWLNKKGRAEGLEDEIREQRMHELMEREPIYKEAIEEIPEARKSKIVIVTDRPEDVEVVGASKEFEKVKPEVTEISSKKQFAPEFERGLFDW